MKSKTSHLPVYIFIIGLFIILGVYFLFRSNISSTYVPNYELEDFYIIPNKQTGINEYTVAYMSEEDTIKSYFSAYIYMVLVDTKESYTYVDDENYNTYQKYLNYVNVITNNLSSLPSLTKYKVTVYDGYTLYSVEDNNGYIYNFKVTSANVYTVSFK